MGLLSGMRNYVKLSVARVTVHYSSGDIEFGAVGEDDEDLKDRIDVELQSLIDNVGQWDSFDYEPVERWVKLDKRFLTDILGSWSENIYFMTDIEPLAGFRSQPTTEESPRKTWSHGQ